MGGLILKRNGKQQSRRHTVERRKKHLITNFRRKVTLKFTRRQNLFTKGQLVGAGRPGIPTNGKEGNNTPIIR